MKNWDTHMPELECLNLDPHGCNLINRIHSMWVHKSGITCDNGSQNLHKIGGILFLGKVNILCVVEDGTQL